MQYPPGQKPPYPVQIVHEKRASVTFNMERLKEILGYEACQVSGLPHDSNTQVTITFEDQTEGSPAYKVGTKARVTVVHDLRHTNYTKGLDY